jgi:hypothetical protein
MRRSTKIHISLPRGSDAFYPAALPLSRQTLDYTARIIRRHRRQIGSCWRKLNPGRQALLVLACLRKGETADISPSWPVGSPHSLGRGRYW